MILLPIACAYCAEWFDPNRKNARYCGKLCRDKARSEMAATARSKRRQAARRRRRQCPRCGDYFSPTSTVGPVAIYCREVCMQRAWRKRNKVATGWAKPNARRAA